MGFIRRIYWKFFKKKHEEAPWLSYYSKEENRIKFTKDSIYEYLVHQVGDDLDFYALNYFGTRITYLELFRKIDMIGRALSSLGTKKGDIVTICMPNTPEAVEAFYACNKIGAVADMVHPLSSSSEIKQYLQNSESNIVILYDDSYQRIESILNETSVEKVILVSASESMPMLLGMGYKITRAFKIKKPNRGDRKFLSWKEFISKGASYKKDIVVKVHHNDLAIILHSGGTTGTPKGIMISNYNFNAEVQQDGVNVYDVRPKDKIITILPIFHGFGLGVCTHCPLCLRVEVILVPEFQPKRFYHIIKKYKPNVLAGVPTLWEAMMSSPRFKTVDLSSMKYVISGGDYMTISMEEKMNTFLRTHGASISISKGYGMTESVAAVAYTFHGTNEPGSIGIPMVGNDMCICKPDTVEVLPYGEEGEICISGPTVMMGYYQNEKETNKVLLEHEDGKIWLHTGDIGYIAPNGVVYFVQRLKRMIVSSGFNVYPSLIEEVIEKHSSVDKCCVIGIPHRYRMQVAKAYVLLKDGCRESLKLKNEIKVLCKKHLAAYSQPKEIEFVKEFPKKLYNKIDYRSLEESEKSEM